MDNDMVIARMMILKVGRTTPYEIDIDGIVPYVNS
jgi:hypothetical protein